MVNDEAVVDKSKVKYIHEIKKESVVEGHTVTIYEEQGTYDDINSITAIIGEDNYVHYCWHDGGVQEKGVNISCKRVAI